jgi:DNA-binding transcriptional MerR regulator
MWSSLAIGDFARATHLSIKTLRHYHSVGLLEPGYVDPGTGYRRYLTDQIPTAQIIRRFRDLDMPLSEIQAVLTAPDLQTRSALIAAHLNRLEDSLARTQQAVASLRDLLQHPAATAAIEHRSLLPAPAAAIRENIVMGDAMSWFQGALGELYATVSAQQVPVAGPPGGIFSNELFARERGQATIFLPVGGSIRQVGRVRPHVVPAAELAIIMHEGSYADIDRAYGSLATYVTNHALAVEGPLREYYLVGLHDTPDQSAWRTEIGWPIFQTGQQGAVTALDG